MNFLAYSIGENFGGGNFWQTIQIKSIGEENLANKLKSVHMPNTFLLYLQILARKILVNIS